MFFLEIVPVYIVLMLADSWTEGSFTFLAEWLRELTINRRASFAVYAPVLDILVQNYVCTPGHLDITVRGNDVWSTCTPTETCLTDMGSVGRSRTLSSVAQDSFVGC